MDINLITLSIALVALCVPWLYDGSLYTRQRVWKRRYRTSAYEPTARRVPIDKDEVRQRARRAL